MSASSSGSDERKKASKGFFAVDVRCLRYACQIGMNAAVSYLVLASGTGGDNVTTSWSVNSIENYTSISRRRAKDAIQQLQKSGLIQQIKSGTMPQYKLPRWEELRGMRVPENLTERLRAVLELIRSGAELDSKQKAAAGELMRRRLVDRAGAQFIIVPPPAPELAFIPNAFVCGAARETPPLERLRQTQDAMAVRLVADLYYTQNLVEDEGLPRNAFHKKFDRHQFGWFGQFGLWGFARTGQCTAYRDHPVVAAHLGSFPDDFQRRPAEERENITRAVWSAFWNRLQLIEDCGVIEWVPHLVEGENKEAEIIHPLCWETADTPEFQLSTAAHEAAVLMAYRAGTIALRELSSTAIQDCLMTLVPVPRHFQNVQLVGVARLRYRAHTKITSAWFGTRMSQMEQHIATYKRLIEENRETAAAKNFAREKAF